MHVYRIPKETIWYTLYHRSEGKLFVAKNIFFLEKEFLSKEVSGRKVELDEAIESSLKLESKVAPGPFWRRLYQQERKLMVLIMKLHAMLLLNLVG
jgi:quinol-cytochrome oxidoreductase complex cytochrome b subunit